MASGEGVFSLNERLEIAISHLGYWHRITLIMVIVGLVALSGIISASQYYFHQEIGKYGHIEEIEVEDQALILLAYIPYSEEVFPSDSIVTLYLTQVWLMIGNGIVIGLFVFLFVWVTYRGSAHRKEFESVEGQFIRQSYLVNFETSLPVGETKVEKILNQAALVFPALNELRRKEYSSKLKIKLNTEIGKNTIDAIVPTKKGDFVVKFYDTVVSIENLKSLCEELSRNRDRIFRLLCVARKFDEELQTDKIVDLIDGLPKYFKLDLIVEEDQGYSMLWID